MNAVKPSEFKLYHYWRSSSSWRVRFAFAVKEIAYEAIPVNLLNGESESPEHLKRHPAGFVPVLEISDGRMLSESLAIIRYLDELYPQATLFPGTAFDHAKIWSLAEIINSGTQPISNIPVYERHSSEKSEQLSWIKHWIRAGLELYEKTAAPSAGKFSYGNSLTLADLCLAPQLYNAHRYEVKFDDLPTIARVHENVRESPAYLASHPDRFMPPDFNP